MILFGYSCCMMEADPVMDVGKILQDARIAKNLSLDTAAQETNIRKFYLEAMEQNDFASLHGDVFVKGVMRTYGNYLGLDGAQLVEEYKAASLGSAPGKKNNNNSIRESHHVKVRPTFKSNRDIGSGNGNDRSVLFIIVGIAAVLLAAAGGIYFYLNQKGQDVGSLLPFRFGIGNEAKSEEKKTTSEESLKTGSVKENAESEKATPDVNTEPGSGVTELKVVSVGKCWLRVTDQKGTVLFEGNLLKGESKSFSSSSNIIMRIGNLKDLTIEHNGKVLPFEDTNEAVTRIYTPKEVR